MPDLDLSLVSSEELSAELAKRNDAMILICYRETTDKQYALTPILSGSIPTLFGLCQFAHVTLLDSIRSHLKPADPDAG